MVVQQHYVGEVGKSITFVLHFFSIAYAVCQICRHYSKMIRGLCFWTHTVGLGLYVATRDGFQLVGD